MEEKNIYEAIQAVMREVGYVQKEKKPGLNYTFAGEAALIAALRPSMIEHGIIMYVKNVSRKEAGSYTTTKGSVMISTALNLVVVFHHTPSGTEIEVETAGEGADTGDKSSNKAMTGAYKYALRQTFMIETGDDPDQFSSENQERKVTERIWSLDVMDGLLEVSAGIASDHETAKTILDLSVLPETTTVKTVQSWFGHFKKALNSGGTFVTAASTANDAYIAAQKKGTK